MIEVYWSFLLTFPLTTGLTILFLILCNTHWQRVSLLSILSAPVLLCILFFLLNTISERYKIVAAAQTPIEEENKLSGKEKKSKVTYYEGVSESSDPWYKNVPILKVTIPALFILWNMFLDFYNVYGPLRFFTGIALAIMFAFFIQTKIILPYRARKNKLK